MADTVVVCGLQILRGRRPDFPHCLSLETMKPFESSSACLFEFLCPVLFVCTDEIDCIVPRQMLNIRYSQTFDTVWRLSLSVEFQRRRVLLHMRLQYSAQELTIFGGRTKFKHIFVLNVFKITDKLRWQTVSVIGHNDEPRTAHINICSKWVMICLLHHTSYYLLCGWYVKAVKTTVCQLRLWVRKFPVENCRKFILIFP